MIKAKGLVHFTIPVKDIDRSEKFYKDLLGFERIGKNKHMVFMRCGRDDFVLTHSEKPIDPNADGDYAIHTAFRVDPDEYDRALKYLRSKGIEIVREETREKGTYCGRSAYFLDPDNNCLEIIDQTNVGQARIE